VFVELARYGALELRGITLGSKLHSLISACYLIVGFLCIFYSYSHQQPYLRMTGIAVLSIGGLLAWLGALRRYRIIADTPTAVVRSAAQGYVELTGECRPIADAELLRYGRVPPCLWYHATIVEQNRTFGRSRANTRFERSDDTFLMADRTGECVIDPEHAEVQSAHQTRWRDGHVHYLVKYLMPGDRLYAIGDMRTFRASDGALNRKADVSALLREWKQNRAALVQHYDRDGDGDIDMQEWQAAVTDAERQVDAQHREMRLEPGIHMMRAPADGRPFILSNRDPDEIRQRFKWWAWFHLATFVAASVWGMMLLLQPTQ